jgi:hypothetical protein
MDIENDQIINSAEADAVVDSTYVVVSIILLQKRCSLNVLSMILETPNFKVTNILFESYEHHSKIILQLLTSFVFLKVGFAPHRRIYRHA